jgi:hypothetical protein
MGRLASPIDGLRAGSCRLADWVISLRGEERKRGGYSRLCAPWPRFACAYADAHGEERCVAHVEEGDGAVGAYWTDDDPPELLA